MKKGNWKVQMGFATGTPQSKNAGWFIVTQSHKDCTLVKAIDETMNTGFSQNEDICASWIFWCEDGDGKLVLPIEQGQAELALTKKFVREDGM